jgi:hypothetical protein
LFADVGKLAGAAFVAAGVAAAARWVVTGYHPAVILMVSGVVFCMAYAAAVLMLRIPSADEVSMVRTKVARLGRVLKAA